MQSKMEYDCVHLGSLPQYWIDCVLTIPSDKLPAFRARSLSAFRLELSNPVGVDTAPAIHCDW